MPDDKYEGIFRKARPRQTVLLIAFSLSLSLACLDLTFSLVSKPECLKNPLHLFPPLAVTAAAVLAAFLAIWFVVIWPMSVLFQWRRGGAAATLAVFAGSAFVFARLARVHPWHFHPAELPTVLFQGTVILAVSAVIAFLTATREGQRYWRASHALAVALPLLAGELLIFSWFSKYSLPGFFTSQTQTALGVAAVAMLLSLLLAYVAAIHSRGLWLLASLALLLFASPALMAFQHITLPSRENPPAWTGQGPKHIVLVTVDSLRRDMVSAYRPDSPVQTRHMDELARASAVFSQAYTASPWTLPSVTSIMTGLWPAVHGVTETRSRVPEQVATLAEALAAAGYRTGATGRNVFLTPAANLGQGFMTYDFYPKSSCYDLDALGAQLLHRFLPSEQVREGTPEELTENACRWIENNKTAPFFYWIHYLDPHMPYSPPAEYLPQTPPPDGLNFAFTDWSGLRTGQLRLSAAGRNWLRELYEGEVRYVDDQIGVLTAWLKRLGLYDDAVIILTIDHGEEFWDHGGWEHGQSVYNELIWAPLLIKLPGGAGHSVDTTVSLTALMPTVLDLCNVAYASGDFSVASLRPLLVNGAGAYTPAPIFADATLYYTSQETVIYEGMKFIRNLASGEEFLFDLTSDPYERKVLGTEHTDALDRGRQLLDRYHVDADALRGRLGDIAPARAEYDPQLEEQLRSLGYGR